MAEAPDWNWSAFAGGAECLKWNRRDVQTLDRVLGIVPFRRAAVQGGGNLGIFPKRLALEFDAVYAFEPDPALFAIMCHNAPEPNIVKMQAALGAKRDLVATKHGTETRTHEGVTHIAGPGIIPTILVDDLGLPHCDLIYLDVEGWEYFALQGAVDTIRRCRPIVACEINSCIRRVGLTGDDIRSFMASFGYVRAFRMRSDDVFVPGAA